MPNLSNDDILRWQKSFKDGGEDYTYDEAADAAFNLIGLFEVLLQVDRRQRPLLYTKAGSKSYSRHCKKKEDRDKKTNKLKNKNAPERGN